jgi:transcriptional regulator with XRE-family HTH domain
VTFGNLLRELRTARGMTSRGQLADACSALEIADDGPDFSEQDIEKIENGGVPSEHELNLLVAALFDPDDPQRRRFIDFARAVRRADAMQAHHRRDLRKMLAHAAALIGGRAHRLSPKMQALRSGLGDIFERTADRLLITETTMEIEHGARLALVDAMQDAHYLDVTVENVGGGEARSIALLLTGPVIKRGTRSLVPHASTEIAVRTGVAQAEHSALVEYADPAASVYVQYLHDPASRLAIRSRVLERPITWWDVNRFIVERLHGEAFRFELSAMDAPVLVDADPGAAEILRAIEPSEPYAAHGFVRYVPERMREGGLPEVAFMSPALNDALWRDERIAASAAPALLDNVESGMRDNASLLIDVLKSKYATLRAEQRFFNEEKVCLGTDLRTASDSVGVFRATYFHGFVTNELAARRVSTRESRPEPLYFGTAHPPFVTSGGRHTLAGIEASGASNHVGASVVLMTGDRRIQFWRQSGGEHGVGKAAATGSGSCDWDDWANLGAGDQDLATMARNAMERELREESGLIGRLLRQERIDCRLLGYFRWVRRGGKPEFVGVAKTAITSAHLWPDPTEVDEPTDTAFFIDAADVTTLKAGIDDLLARDDTLSLPLWVALTCLRSRCDDPDCRTFFWP